MAVLPKVHVCSKCGTDMEVRNDIRLLSCPKCVEWIDPYTTQTRTREIVIDTTDPEFIASYNRAEHRKHMEKQAKEHERAMDEIALTFVRKHGRLPSWYTNS